MAPVRSRVPAGTRGQVMRTVSELEAIQMHLRRLPRRSSRTTAPTKAAGSLPQEKRARGDHGRGDDGGRSASLEEENEQG